MKKRMARLQWQFIRHSFFITMITSILILFLMTYDNPRGLLLVYDNELVGIPVIIWIILFILLTGFTGGYIQADPIKKRIDQLLHGAVRYERGTFSHRVALDGEDELAELAERMNQMAAHIEEQVASLQRLSSERAMMQETVKKAAVTEERQRLARDLHDAVSQQLFAISMMTAAIKQGFVNADETSKQQMELVEQMANTAQAEMRALLLHLRPAHLEGKSLREGVRNLFEELEQKQNINIVCEMDPDTSIPKGIEDQLFRLIQEAISNILRHAKATHVEFQLKQTRQEIKVKIIDNGIGFHSDTIKHGSYGMQTMRERVNEVGGVLQVVSVPSKGTQIEAKVPIAWQGEEME
ncbi:HAMP domain-containing sensor histidine kinase [Halalkalibacter urbisdiaboli]|uniref:HAMP domain-containing sensor histidine kinase n=1 Tax=Halalkalibacter urbisdiaboli TaxID=1960589 RepID=UPI000B435AEB|nr:sensor histidine kinase [Halalkalibacter urbisdiaboli]